MPVDIRKLIRTGEGEGIPAPWRKRQLILPILYLSWVPGQAAFDRAVNNYRDGNNIGSGVNVAAMLGEQALTVLTLGEGQLAAKSLSSYSAGIADYFFARKYGLLNTNDYFRIGYGWSGSALQGHKVFRIGIGSKRLPFHWHKDLWKR